MYTYTYIHAHQIYNIRIIIKELKEKKTILMRSHNNMSIRAIAITPSKIMALFNVVASINQQPYLCYGTTFCSQCVNVGVQGFRSVHQSYLTFKQMTSIRMMNLICLRKPFDVLLFYLGQYLRKFVNLNHFNDEVHENEMNSQDVSIMWNSKFTCEYFTS